MTAQKVVQYADIRVWSGSAAPTARQTLSGTGTTEDSNSTKLTGGEMAALLVGGEAVRVMFSGSTGGSSQVATTDPIIGANQLLTWFVTTGKDDVVYVEAADGSSAYEAWVWTASGARK